MSRSAARIDREAIASFNTSRAKVLRARDLGYPTGSEICERCDGTRVDPEAWRREERGSDDCWGCEGHGYTVEGVAPAREEDPAIPPGSVYCDRCGGRGDDPHWSADGADCGKCAGDGFLFLDRPRMSLVVDDLSDALAADVEVF